MEPSRAGKIIKEFKTPQETERVQKILDLIRVQPAPGEDESMTNGLPERFAQRDLYGPEHRIVIRSDSNATPSAQIARTTRPDRRFHAASGSCQGRGNAGLEIEPTKNEIASKPKSAKTAKSPTSTREGCALTATTTPEDSDAADVKDTSELSNAADTEISPQPETQTPAEPSVKPIDAPPKAAQVGALAACKNQVLIDGTAALPAHREASGLAQPLTTSTAAPATPAAVDPTSTPESGAAKISEESASPQSIKLPPPLKSTPKQVDSSLDGSPDDVPESLAIQPTPKVFAASPSNPAANVSGGEAAPASVDATTPLAEVAAPADDLRNVAGLVPQLHAPSLASHGSTPASQATAAPADALRGGESRGHRPERPRQSPAQWRQHAHSPRSAGVGGTAGHCRDARWLAQRDVSDEQ